MESECEGERAHLLLAPQRRVLGVVPDGDLLAGADDLWLGEEHVPHLHAATTRSHKQQRQQPTPGE